MEKSEKALNNKMSFDQLCEISIANNNELQKEIEFVKKLVPNSFIEVNQEENIGHKKWINFDISQYQDQELIKLSNEFDTLKTELLKNKGCFMDDYKFEQNEAEWLLSLIDQNNQNNNRILENEKTTRVIVNKLDI
ncbi:hypothetical protein GE118_00850 [Mycoplasma sp. NEAQ87857]|uniref:hypothetical protein n=1 Tax=Mycoplasma sp. NEAQ87857 TaxID=2683967 RepID=UPI0013196EC8|nr:hypothetical protein [Mycoplasma sp. NEAQ87857]QGZ97350.1 hypothetical protein GE118_00850 [Mycoplasma sp. NEAQ87857]